MTPGPVSAAGVSPMEAAAARVSAAAAALPWLRLVPGFALDLITCDENGVPWDFCVRANRE